MKNFFSTITAIALTAGMSFQAQTLNSGDKDMDLQLKEINVEAKADLTGFKATLKADFNLSDQKITLMLKTMEPSDIFMAATIAKIVVKPVELVTASYAKNKGKGWGVIAKEMGIKPGSAEFHKLKDATKGKHGAMKNKGKGPKKMNPGKSSELKEKPVQAKPGKAGKSEKLEPAKGQSPGKSGKM